MTIAITLIAAAAAAAAVAELAVRRVWRQVERALAELHDEEG